MITITAYKWVPPFAQGLVRDLRVRWALEEAGLPYNVRLLEQGEQNTDPHRVLQPFEQIPTLEEGDLTLFESGAIVLHIAQRSEALMPAGDKARARMTAWLIAALNSIEPYVASLVEIDLFHPDEDWAKQRRPGAVDALQHRLDCLSAWLDGRDYLEDRFTAADLMMTTVLRIPRHTDLVTGMPVLEAYRRRCEARPAFEKALAGQMAPFNESASAPDKVSVR